ncbi:hypothetical protein [Niveispirillum irakense]|uniref:hypothetical protein n=1 Tax=Niveispirillum irakense TaxID=34011 RepID=UPI0004011692|nr:hypothetical protein [Niveispirillum irakense]
MGSNVTATNYQGPTSWIVVIQPGPNNNYAGNATLSVYMTSSSTALTSFTFSDGNNTWTSGRQEYVSGDYTMTFDHATWSPPYTTASGNVSGTIVISDLVVKQNRTTVLTFSGTLFQWDVTGAFSIPGNAA